MRIAPGTNVNFTTSDSCVNINASASSSTNSISAVSIVGNTLDFTRTSGPNIAIDLPAPPPQVNFAISDIKHQNDELTITQSNGNSRTQMLKAATSQPGNNSDSPATTQFVMDTINSLMKMLNIRASPEIARVESSALDPPFLLKADGTSHALNIVFKVDTSNVVDIVTDYKQGHGEFRRATFVSQIKNILTVQDIVLESSDDVVLRIKSNTLLSSSNGQDLQVTFYTISSDFISD